MFETLFNYAGVLRRHNEGPLAAERAAYLSAYLSVLAAQGMARGTILRRSSYSLCVAIELQRWPPDQCFKKGVTHYCRGPVCDPGYPEGRGCEAAVCARAPFGRFLNLAQRQAMWRG
jgi:hypothetical protein